MEGEGEARLQNFRKSNMAYPFIFQIPTNLSTLPLDSRLTGTMAMTDNRMNVLGYLVLVSDFSDSH